MIDVAVIGAGPAGLFFAYELLSRRPGTSVVIIDAGVSIRKRVCPLVDEGTCKGCQLCLAVYGGGGAGMYSDGKLAMYPAGSGLANLLGDDAPIIEANKRVINLVRHHTTSPHISSTSQNGAAAARLHLSAQEASLDLKRYDVQHIGTEGIQDFTAKFEMQLIAMGVRFRWLHTVVNVTAADGAFELTLEDLRGNQTEVVAGKLVLAAGKPSNDLVRRTLTEVGAAWSFNDIELGVRVEAAREGVSDISACHLDAKLKAPGDHLSELRTFCICDGGYLVSCYYDTGGALGRICTISGFSYAEHKSDVCNFGLLVRTKFPSHVDPIAVLGPVVSAINQASGHGGTIVQRYGDFLARRPTTSEGLASNTVRSTLPTSTPTDLHWIYPSATTANIALFMEKLAQLSPAIGHPDTLLHGPVFELINDRIQVSSTFETTAKGLFVIGDATGLARGIVQAATSGLLCGAAVAAELREMVASASAHEEGAAWR